MLDQLTWSGGLSSDQVSRLPELAVHAPYKGLGSGCDVLLQRGHHLAPGPSRAAG